MVTSYDSSQENTTMDADYKPTTTARGGSIDSALALEPAAACDARTELRSRTRAFSDGHELRAAVAARTVPIDLGVTVVFADSSRARIYADPVLEKGAEVREALMELKDAGHAVQFDAFRNCHVAHPGDLARWLSTSSGATCKALAEVLAKGATRCR